MNAWSPINQRCTWHDLCLSPFKVYKHQDPLLYLPVPRKCSCLSYIGKHSFVAGDNEEMTKLFSMRTPRNTPFNISMCIREHSSPTMEWIESSTSRFHTYERRNNVIVTYELTAQSMIQDSVLIDAQALRLLQKFLRDDCVTTYLVHSYGTSQKGFPLPLRALSFLERVNGVSLNPCSGEGETHFWGEYGSMYNISLMLPGRLFFVMPNWKEIIY